MTSQKQIQMEAWAREAGAVLKKHFRQLSHIAEKRTIDLVTVADEEAEKVILGSIRKHYPDHHILAEESGKSHEDLGELFWVIDPLDGTARIKSFNLIFLFGIFFSSTIPTANPAISNLPFS